MFYSSISVGYRPILHYNLYSVRVRNVVYTNRIALYLVGIHNVTWPRDGCLLTTVFNLIEIIQQFIEVCICFAHLKVKTLMLSPVNTRHHRTGGIR